MSLPPEISQAPFRKVRFGPVDTIIERHDAGAILYRSTKPLAPHPTRFTERLDEWADKTPERIFIARRSPNGKWQELTYSEILVSVRRIAQALLDRNLSKDRTIAILSENSLEHLMLSLAAMHIGIPYAPISPPYSLVSKDFKKLKHTIGLMTPGLVFVQDGRRYGKALNAIIDLDADVEVVIVEHPPADMPWTLFSSLTEVTATDAVDRAHDRVESDTIAKVLFTSGSTAMPKGVINTHGMLCANLQQIAQALPFITDDPPLVVDWLPWNHTFGGNHNVGMILFNGGSFYIDEGKPSPKGIEITVANLRELAPTMYFNVPKGFEELLRWLQKEPDLAKTFFSRLKMLFYAGASLSQPVRDGLAEIAVKTCGERIPIVTGLGMTEASPAALFANWPGGFSGLVGVPVAGMEMKLLPHEEKLEVRYRGPNITPGYWRQPDLTAACFDEEGYFKTGDAVKFVDEDQPDKGLLFDGRVVEDFKLTTGTWVNVGILRVEIIKKGQPLIRDAVITGQDRDYVGAILFLSPDECHKLAGLENFHPLSDAYTHPAVVSEVQRILDDLSQHATGSASRIVRAAIAVEPPSIDLGEVTDKGSLNQRAILRHRKALVEKLYTEPRQAGILEIKIF